MKYSDYIPEIITHFSRRPLTLLVCMFVIEKRRINLQGILKEFDNGYSRYAIEMALQDAVSMGYIKRRPSSVIALPIFDLYYITAKGLELRRKLKRLKREFEPPPNPIKKLLNFIKFRGDT